MTANTTGKITVGHGLVYDALRKKEGLESAAAYLAANTVAVSYTHLFGLSEFGVKTAAIVLIVAATLYNLVGVKLSLIHI